MAGDHSGEVYIIGHLIDGVVAKCSTCGMLISIRVSNARPIIKSGGDPAATHSFEYKGSNFSIDFQEEPIEPLSVQDEKRLKVFEDYFNDKSK